MTQAPFYRGSAMINLLLMLLVMLVSLLSATAHASVVMVGTRVIYSGDAREKTINFQNNSDVPHIVQLWLDTKARDSKIESAQSPFLATPQIFRIDPRRGQMVRLVMLEPGSVPQDRESVYYLSFSQIPGNTKSDIEGQNTLTVLFTNRVKVFYRPKGLPRLPANITESLQASLDGNQIIVKNPTPFHVSLSNAQLKSGGMSSPIGPIDMLPPFSETVWQIPPGSSPKAGTAELVFTAINDFGNSMTGTVTLR